MATFYKFGKLWEIPPAAARLGKSQPANTTAFETFLTNLEPMFSNFIMAHPRCPTNPDLPAVRYALKAFMEEQAAQCGYCLNGMIMMATELLIRIPHPTEAELRDELARNLCRCGTHNRIIRAIMRAAQASGRN